MHLFRQEARETIQNSAESLDDALLFSAKSASERSGRRFCGCMVMLFDTELYDPESNTWQIGTYLEKKREQLGPIDLLIPWHGYPRLGADERNQFDFWRDLPGGSEGMREFVQVCHREGVRVAVPYNPWDTGTRREDKSDYELLADLVGATGADGVFLDTLSAGSAELRRQLNRVRPGLDVITEGNPSLQQLPLISGSWGQWLASGEQPGIIKLQWIEPGYPEYLIRRWDRDRSEEIKTALFNGSGMLVWENVFGTTNPWNSCDGRSWKKANLILHYFSDLFACGKRDPFLPAIQSDLYVNGWTDETSNLYVLINKGEKINDKALIEIPYQEGKEYYDLWAGKQIQLQLESSTALINGSVDRIGCILSIRKSEISPGFKSLQQQLNKIDRETCTAESEVTLPAVCLEVKNRTGAASKENFPAGMVYVPGGEFTMRIRHPRRECGCYLDRPVEHPKDFGYGLQFGAVYPQVIHQDIEHTIGPVEIRPFFIDETEVTNRQYEEFLEASRYRPKHPETFLKHWRDGKMPLQLADHPVVYVDLEDAKAYAEWAGKRLPTEFEWQLAAQGTDERKWPWGMEFDAAKCNSAGQGTMPVRSLPEGKSPCGCYHMSGNVWEWTDAEYSDGHTRFVMIRGGSFYRAEGSVWYMDGGPQPCEHHAKFILTWPGLDRCSTVGFRCVKDAE